MYESDARARYDRYLAEFDDSDGDEPLSWEEFFDKFVAFYEEE